MDHYKPVYMVVSLYMQNRKARGANHLVKMSYLNTETEAYIKNDADVTTRTENEPDCVVSQFRKLVDLEAAYCSVGSNHVPRSLDQSYYVVIDSLEDSVDQDRDQVVYKYTKEQLINSEMNDPGGQGNASTLKDKKQTYLFFLKSASVFQERSPNSISKRQQGGQDSKLPASPTETVFTADQQSVEIAKTERFSKHAKILMVNQLWLWSVDDSILTVIQGPVCSALIHPLDPIITALSERWDPRCEKSF